MKIIILQILKVLFVHCMFWFSMNVYYCKSKADKIVEIQKDSGY